MPNEADIQADLELDGTRAVSQIKRVASELRTLLTDAQNVEAAMQRAFFGQRTSLVGPRAKGLTRVTGRFAQGSDRAATINAVLRGRQAEIRASNDLIREAVRKQDEQLKRAQAAPGERARASRQRFDDFFGVRDGRLTGEQRTRYENAYGKLLDQRERLQRRTEAQRRQARQQFDNFFGVRDGRLTGNARTQYENSYRRLLGERDRIQAQVERQAIGRFAQASKAYEQRQAAIRQGQAQVERDAIQRFNNSSRLYSQRQAAQQREFQRSPAGVAERGAGIRELRNQTLFGDGGRDLFRIQARLLAHYVVLNQVFNAYRFGVSFVVDFDRALQNLQAITVTSNTNMQALSLSLRQVSRETKFTAVEVAEAATILGQAGFSTTEIRQSIRSITLLAAATGSTLKQAVDVATSTLGVFNLQASEMSSVADQITTSINRSKLNIEKLALGLQFAGNVAADAGLGLDELLASLAQFANAGVRSGSTLGTGIRQLIIDLAAPSRKLSARYRELGLTTDRVNIQTQGFIGVLRNLRDAGFTGSDALEFLEVRAANAFSAITKGLPEIEGFRRQLILANSAARANATQMESLANRWSRFVSVMGEVVLTGTGPVANLFKTILDGATSIAIAIADSGSAFSVFASVLTGVGISALGVWLARVLGLTRGVTGATLAISGMTIATRGLNAALALTRTLFTTFSGLLGLGIFAGIGLLTDGFGLFSQSIEEAASQQDRAQAAFEDTKGRVDTLEQSINSINDTIARLSLREQRLDENQGELQTELLRTTERFRGLGLEIDGNVTSTGQLIQSLFQLRRALQDATPAAIQAQLDSLNQQRVLGDAEIRERLAAQRPGEVDAFLSGLGFPRQRGAASSARRDRPARRRFFDDPRGPAVSAGQRAGEVISGIGNRQFPPGVFEAFRGEPGQRAGLSDAVATILQYRFQTGQLDEGQIARAEAQLRDFSNNVRPDAGGDRAREFTAQLLTSLQQARKELNERRLRSQIGTNLTERLNVAQFRDLYGTEIDSSFNRLQSITRGRFAATQVFPDDPERTRTALEDFVSRTERDAPALRDFLRSRVAPEDQGTFDQVVGAQFDNLVKAQRRLADQHSERVLKISRERIGARRKVINRRITNYRTRISRAKTPEEVESVLLEMAAGLSPDLVEQSGIGDLLSVGVAPPGAGPAGALAQRAALTADELRTVSEVGKPSATRRDLRESAANEQIAFLEGVRLSAERRLERLGALQGRIDRTTAKTRGRRGGDIGRQAGELRAEAQNELVGIRGRLSAFDIQQRGRGGLRGQARQTARLELEEDVLQDSITVYRDWRRAQQDIIDSLENRAEAQATTLANSRTEFQVAVDSNESLKQQSVLAKDVDRATANLNKTTGQLSTARKQLLQIDRELTREELKLAAIPQQLSVLEQIIKSIDQSLQGFSGFESILRIAQGATKATQGFFVESIRNGIDYMVNGFEGGTKKLIDIFRDFVNKILDVAINELANNLTAIIFNSVKSGLGGASGSGGLLGFFQGIFGGGGGFTGTGVGRVPVGFAQTGGRVVGGTRGRDSVPLLTTPDEFVLRADSARSIGYDTLNRLNQRGAAALRPLQGNMPSAIVQQSGPSELNVWVAMPDQIPPPSEKDIVAAVGNDIQRNGSVKKLIKRVQIGEI